MHARRGEYREGVSLHVDAQEQERANLIADILVSAFGDDTEQMLADGNDFVMLTKAFGTVWDESKYERHPVGSPDEAEFNLADGSRSMQVLNRYMLHKKTARDKVKAN